MRELILTIKDLFIISLCIILAVIIVVKFSDDNHEKRYVEINWRQIIRINQ